MSEGTLVEATHTAGKLSSAFAATNVSEEPTHTIFRVGRNTLLWNILTF
jgi:hypothetical protein